MFKFKSWFSFFNKTECEIENEFKKELKSNGFQTDKEADEFAEKLYIDNFKCILMQLKYRNFFLSVASTSFKN
jgi:hypothetical protein